MTHFDRRLEQDLERIRDDVVRTGKLVENALGRALDAVLSLDCPLAYETILGDKLVNRRIEKLDTDCHSFVARHLPTAGHVRFISSVLRLNVEIERVGDYATTICREAVQFSSPLSPPLRREVERMGKKSMQMLHQALTAFDESNVELAKATIFGDPIERSFSTAFDELVRQSEAHTGAGRDEFATLVIFNMLERVADQACNICQETVFAVTGETRPATPYRVLFLDETNACLGPMAVSIARRGYPSTGKFYTAGLRPAEDFAPAFRSFMTQHGSVVPEAPRGVDAIGSSWEDYYVLVCLEGAVAEYVERVPFRTVAFEWRLTPPDPESSEALEAAYRELASRVRTLVEALQGEDGG